VALFLWQFLHHTQRSDPLEEKAVVLWAVLALRAQFRGKGKVSVQYAKNPPAAIA
jgi:hypothetical protein